MIGSFRHRGLKRLYEAADASKVPSHLLQRVEEILGLLDVAVTAHDMALPGYRLHKLKGDLKGHWSVTVSGNWRIIFRIESGNAVDVDLLDYH